MTNVERGRPRTINLEPDWDGMRHWVQHVHKTDPETAIRIAMQMGREAPELPDNDHGDGSVTCGYCGHTEDRAQNEPCSSCANAVEPGSYDHPDFE